MSVVAAAVIALGGALCGATLARTAFALESSDERADWRGVEPGVRAAWTLTLVAASTIAAIAAWTIAPGAAVGVAVTAFAAASPGIAVVDMAARRIPFVITGAVAAVALLALAFTPYLARSLITAAAVAVVMIVLALASRGGVGGGDVAAASVVAMTLAWAGLEAVVLALAAGMLLSGITGLGLRLAHRDVALVPFGPFLFVGWWLAIIYSIMDLMGKRKAPQSDGVEACGPRCRGPHGWRQRRIRPMRRTRS
ncbi:prepilin peptidase [Glycomyces tenuis]|uniref:prepilin peptidase n=1 Tax=Glycomyces tenuis TaxID=58116 RepID=UPI000686D59E|nr:prepilin peptidase [Glycomyces tenuis]